MIHKKTKKKQKKLIFVKSIYTEDDFKVIPEEIHEKICKVILEKLQPAILDYMKTFENFTIRGLTVEHISYEYLSSYHGSLEPAFKIQHQYDLHLMKRNLCFPVVPPEDEYYKIAGKRCVGAAIRISKWIGKPEYAHDLEKIVQDFFTPEGDPGPKALSFDYL
jgi:hypothetical protein